MHRLSVVSKRRSKIGESPNWDSRINRLVYVDIFEGLISRLDPETQQEEVISYDGDYVSLAVPSIQDPNHLIIGRNRQICELHWDSKKLTVCAEVEPGLQTRFNDGKCDVNGRLWAGTMSLEVSNGVFADDCGALYSMDSSNCIKLQEGGVKISNGIAFDKANKTMFFVDSIPKQIYAFDYDAETGALSNKRTIVDYNKSEGFFGLPDGMTIDADDKLWVACFNGSRIICIDPNTGTILRTVHFPCQKVTSCIFGGPNYDILYATTGWLGLDEKERSDQPTAGAVFKITDLGVKGLPPYFYSA